MENQDLTPTTGIQSGVFGLGKDKTAGMKLVGIDFNPSGDPKVNRLKMIMAEAYDIVKESYNTKCSHPEATQEFIMSFQHTLGEILNAQMNCVKIVTWKF